MSETYAERKARILRDNPTTDASFYDEAVLFGYEPESWDGMWKLRAHWPIIRISRNWAIAAEAVEQPGTHKAARNWRGKAKTRYRLRRARA